MRLDSNQYLRRTIHYATHELFETSRTRTRKQLVHYAFTMTISTTQSNSTFFIYPNFFTEFIFIKN